MVARLRRWHAYRQYLAASLREHEAGGYRVSSPVYRRLQAQARERAGY